MAKKTVRKRGQTDAGERWPVVAVKLVFALGLAVALLVGLIWLGHRSADRITDRDRYTVRLSDLKFNTPVHLDPRVFLTEVRYLGDLPDTVQTIDPKLTDRLTTAFRRHPWVADVRHVSVTPENTVHLDLQFRVPVLAVWWRSGTEREVRAVDASGILLPAGAPVDTLPMLVNEQTGAKPEAGQIWLDPDVRRAADLVSRNAAKTIERTKTGWKITEPDGKVYSITTP
jgi:hypothetical protein